MRISQNLLFVFPVFVSVFFGDEIPVSDSDNGPFQELIKDAVWFCLSHAGICRMVDLR